MLKKLSIISFLSISLIACGDSDTELVPATTIPTSAETTYSSIAVLGDTVNDAAAIDAGPEVSSNGLELYFHSNRTGSLGGFDLYVAKRATIFDIWGIAASLGATINTAGDDRAASLS